MFTLKLFTLFLITKSTISSRDFLIPFYWDKIYPSDSLESTESSECISNEDFISPGPKLSQICAEEEQSLISNSDVKYLIEDIAVKLQVKENFVNNYYPEAKKLLEDYLHDLKELQEALEDRPVHMLHILGDFADMRQRLEPEVERIEDQLQTFHVREQKYNDIADHSAAVLTQLEKYKKICKINCEDFDIDQRFGRNTHTNFISAYHVNNDMSCVKLKELIEYITTRLNRFEDDFGYVLLNELASRNEIYAQKINELKNNLKKTAVKEFGMTMYDMLSLQDDYHHFLHKLKHNNISAELDRIEENSAEIKLRLIGLKRDVEKFKQYCMSCNSNNRQAKRDVTFEYDDIVYIGKESNIVDELLNAEMDEIKHFVQSHYNNIFEELDTEFNDPDIINSYVSKLKPIQYDVEHKIKHEQEALETLRNRVPTLTMENIVALSKESKRMIQSLEAAKQYVDQFSSV